MIHLSCKSIPNSHPCFLSGYRHIDRRSSSSPPIRNDLTTICFGNTIQVSETEKSDDPPPSSSYDLESFLVVFGPAILFVLAFALYEITFEVFHDFVQFAAQNNFELVDGGAELTDQLIPSLNGPVSTSISILFGTLTSMTVGHLYNRQAKLQTLFSDILEDLRLAELHFDYFPTDDYKNSANDKLDEYKIRLLKNLNLGSNRPTPEEEDRVMLEELMRLLHQMAQDPTADVTGNVLDESYGTVNRILKMRSELRSTFENQFPIWHYGNLGLLALSILIIFLVESDKSALQYLGGFQLRLCWAILIGTFSMLASVIYDLTTPLTGSYQVSKKNQIMNILWLVGQLSCDACIASIPYDRLCHVLLIWCFSSFYCRS